MDLVQVLPNALKCPCVSIKHALKKQGIKTLKPLISQGFQVSVSILVTQDGTLHQKRYFAFLCYRGHFLLHKPGVKMMSRGLFHFSGNLIEYY